MRLNTFISGRQLGWFAGWLLYWLGMSAASQAQDSVQTSSEPQTAATFYERVDSLLVRLQADEEHQQRIQDIQALGRMLQERPAMDSIYGRRIGDFLAELKLDEQKAAAYIQQGAQFLYDDPAQARSAYEKARKLYQEDNNLNGRLSALMGIARSHALEQNAPLAREFYQRADKLVEDHKLSAPQAYIKEQRAHWAYQAGSQDEAVKAMEAAAKSYEQQKALREAASAYARLAQWLHDKNQTDQAIAYRQQAAQLFYENGDREASGHELLALGRLYQEDHRYQEAFQAYLVADNKYESSDLSNRARARTQALQSIFRHAELDERGVPEIPGPGWAEKLRQLQFAGLTDWCRKSADLLQQAKLPSGRQLALFMLGAYQFQKGAVGESLRSLQEAGGIRNGSAAYKGAIFRALGAAYEASGSIRNAEAAYQQALQAFADQNQAVLSGRMAVVLGRLYQKRGAYEKSIPLLESAREQLSADPGSRSALEAHILLGRAYWRQDALPKARTTLQQASELADQLRLPPQAVQVQALMGHVYWQSGQLQQARSAWENALQHPQQNLDRDLLALSYRRLGSAWENAGRKSEALNNYRQSLQLYREMKATKEMARLYDLIGVLLTDLGYWQQAATQLDSAQKMWAQTAMQQEQAANFLHQGELFRRQAKWDEAEAMLAKSLDAFGARSSSRSRALLVLGRVYLAQGKASKAMSSMEKAWALDQGGADSLHQAELLFVKGHAHLALGQYRSASEQYREALSIYKTRNKPIGMAQCHRALGQVALNRGRLEEARSQYEKALSVGRSAEKPADRARSLVRIAEIYHRRGGESAHRKGLQKLEQAQKELQGQTDRVLEARIASSMASHFAALGMSRQAITRYQEALRIHRALNRQADVARCLEGLGAIYYEQKQWAAALEYFKDAEDQYEPSGERVSGETLARMARLLAQQKNLDEAIAYHRRAAETFEERAQPGAAATSRGEAAALHMKLEQWGPARSLTQKALEGYRQANREPETAEMLVQLGDIDQAMEAYGSASSAFRQALTRYESLDFRGEAARIWNRLGNLAMEREQHDEALSSFERAEAIYRNLDNRRNVAFCLHYEGEAYRRQARGSQRSLLQQAIDRQHKARSLAQSLDDQLILVDVYEALRKCYQSLGAKDSTIKYLDLYAKTKDSIIPIQQVESEKLRAQRDNLLQQKELELKEARIEQEQTRRNALAGGLGLFVLLSVGIFYQYRQAHKARQRAEIEHQRSEELLLNILPAHTAQELKDQGRTEARHYDDASIVFADIKGFTMLSEKLPPAELVELLNTYFRAFDEIMLKYGLEKIKTIGDAYMAVGKLPEGNKATAMEVVEAALAMQEFAQTKIELHQAAGTPPFAFRIGIHTGPVVAGVVGIKKFQYDIWGDTVNMAARMEQSGESGRVNISEDTYQLVKDHFQCTHRGKIAAKNKGEVDMYFVERPVRKTRKKKRTVSKEKKPSA